MIKYTLEEIHLLRGVTLPCSACDGLGTRTYGADVTWFKDKCDKCNGSGDAWNVW